MGNRNKVGGGENYSKIIEKGFPLTWSLLSPAIQH
jgi:hypothetical protein